MSKDLNQCNFIGRIGKDVELKYMPNGKAVVNISIACGDDYKNKPAGEKVEKTNWINIVAFDRLAEIIGQYCGKGSKIYISGKQETRKWKDQQGADRYTTEIVANEMQMLDSKPSDGVGKQAAAQAQQRNNGYVNRGSNMSNGEAMQSSVSGNQARQQQSAAPVGHGSFDEDIPF